MTSFGWTPVPTHSAHLTPPTLHTPPRPDRPPRPALTAHPAPPTDLAWAGTGSSAPRRRCRRSSLPVRRARSRPRRPTRIRWSRRTAVSRSTTRRCVSAETRPGLQQEGASAWRRVPVYNKKLRQGRDAPPQRGLHRTATCASLIEQEPWSVLRQALR